MGEGEGGGAEKTRWGELSKNNVKTKGRGLKLKLLL